MLDLFVDNGRRRRQVLACTTARFYAGHLELLNYTGSFLTLEERTNSQKTFQFYDRIFFMDEQVAKEARDHYKIDDRKVHVLGLSDPEVFHEDDFEEGFRKGIEEKVWPYLNMLARKKRHESIIIT